MDWTIREIESITPAQLECWQDAEREEIKGHEVYFVNLGRHFGLSAIVCADGRQIKYANEYQLHYPESLYHDEQSVRTEMRRRLEAKLFTEEELAGECESYEELNRKKNFIRNYYGDRREHQSIFCYGEPAEWYQREKDTAILNPVTYAYYPWYERDFVKHCVELYEALCAANDPLRDYEHAKDAFMHEMFNHEYAINWQGDWDVISCFCKVEYAGDGSEIEQTGWSDEIRRAYRDAAREVTRNGEW